MQKKIFFLLVHHLLGSFIHSFGSISENPKTEAHQWGNRDPQSHTRCVPHVATLLPEF